MNWTKEQMNECDNINWMLSFSVHTPRTQWDNNDGMASRDWTVSELFCPKNVCILHTILIAATMKWTRTWSAFGDCPASHGCQRKIKIFACVIVLFRQFLAVGVGLIQQIQNKFIHEERKREKKNNINLLMGDRCSWSWKIIRVYRKAKRARKKNHTETKT